ncbi:MAG: hypothetical protein ABS939_08415 [Psychrobacillus sp.]
MAERTPTIHKTEIMLNKRKLADILYHRGMEYTELHRKIVDKYGLDISYKGFMSLLSNRSTWKLLYAHAISDILLIDYMEIFEIVSIDVEKVKKAKEKWKEKYQNK